MYDGQINIISKYPFSKNAFNNTQKPENCFLHNLGIKKILIKHAAVLNTDRKENSPHFSCSPQQKKEIPHKIFQERKM